MAETQPTLHERLQAMLEEAESEVERIEGNRTALDVIYKQRADEWRKQIRASRNQYVAERKAMTDELTALRKDRNALRSTLKVKQTPAEPVKPKRVRKVKQADEGQGGEV